MSIGSVSCNNLEWKNGVALIPDLAQSSNFQLHPRNQIQNSTTVMRAMDSSH